LSDRGTVAEFTLEVMGENSQNRDDTSLASVAGRALLLNVVEVSLRNKTELLTAQRLAFRPVRVSRKTVFSLRSLGVLGVSAVEFCPKRTHRGETPSTQRRRRVFFRQTH
jgi:hypothetical protein